MDAIAQSSIFFIITSISVVIMTLLVALILIYILKIVRDIRSITNNVRKGSETLSGDMSQVHDELEKKGALSGFIIAVIAAIVAGRRKKNRVKKNREE